MWFWPANEMTELISGIPEAYFWSNLSNWAGSGFKMFLYTLWDVLLYAWKYAYPGWRQQDWISMLYHMVSYWTEFGYIKF